MRKLSGIMERVNVMWADGNVSVNRGLEASGRYPDS